MALLTEVARDTRWPRHFFLVTPMQVTLDMSFLRDSMYHLTSVADALREYPIILKFNLNFSIIVDAVNVFPFF